MSRLAPLDLFIRQALLYPLIAPFLPAVGNVRKDTSYAAGKLTGTLEVGTVITAGTIVMWKGAIVNIPAGWVLCDGNNDTPDLRNNFIVGAGDEYAVDAAGGEKEHTLTEAEMPAHVHPSVGIAGATYGDGVGGPFMNFGNSGSKGGSGAHENRPPYYALAFIMKT